MLIDDLKLKQSHNKAKTIAMTMLPIPIIIALLGELAFKNMVSEFPISVYNTLQYILIALTTVEIISMIVFKNLILSGSMKPVISPQNKELSEEDTFLLRLFSSFLITYTLCLSISIYGVILLMLGKDSSIFFGFIGASFFLMVVQFPRFDEWESRLQNYIE